MPELEFRVWPDIGNVDDIEYALVWQPAAPAARLASSAARHPSLGAGIDHILADPDLPAAVPVVRLVDPHMVAAMAEYVVAHVLRLHRQDLAYAAQQRRRE